MERHVLYCFVASRTQAMSWACIYNKGKTRLQSKIILKSKITLTPIEIVILIVHRGQLWSFVDIFHLLQHFYQATVTSREVDTNWTIPPYLMKLHSKFLPFHLATHFTGITEMLAFNCLAQWMRRPLNLAGMSDLRSGV